MSHTDLIIDLNQAVLNLYKIHTRPVGSLRVEGKKALVDELTLELRKARDEAGLCAHFRPCGECKVRRCRLTEANATMARLSKKYKWFGVRS